MKKLHLESSLTTPELHGVLNVLAQLTRITHLTYDSVVYIFLDSVIVSVKLVFCLVLIMVRVTVSVTVSVMFSVNNG